MSKNIEITTKERNRQITEEGWTAAHDDQWINGELVDAAACYLLCNSHTGYAAWPWDESWWKPTTTRRNIEKAVALLIAELDRLDRIT